MKKAAGFLNITRNLQRKQVQSQKEEKEKEKL
jgi:hypothetical protein